MTDLEARIKSFANAMEDKIEFGLREAMIAEDETQRGKAHEELCESLQQIVKDIDLVQEESKKIQDHRGRQASTWSLARDTSSKKLPNLEVSNKSSKLLGWEALARQLQQNKFLTILRFSPALMFVPELLYRKNIIRNNEVARYDAAENLCLQMGLMSPVESCNLFRSGGFANEELPSEFETNAKQIEDKCHASPLTIVVVAGIVKSKRTIKDLKNFAKDVKSPVTNDPDEQCSHVLGLSHNHSTSSGTPNSLYSRINDLWNLTQVIIAKAYVNIVDMAHASVASLSKTIESLLTSNSPMQSITCDHSEDFSALHEKVSSLEVFLKNFEKNNVSGEMTDFEVEVKEVASAVEYTIQLRLTETITEKNKSIIGITGSKFFKGISNIWTRRKFRKSLQQLAKDIDCVWKESTKIQDKGKQVSEGSLVQDFSSSTNDILNVNNDMVGRDDQKEHLLEDLTGSYSGEPKVIPIVGMGGIGKTTLAKEVYNHGSMLRRFDVRAWATVSQQHNIKEILLSLLQSTIKMDDMVKTKGEAELADLLQKSLKRKRYLIVLDDIWSCEVWDGVRQCFPTEDNAGSRILLTTRNKEVACYAGTENLSMQINFMDQDESWNLFKSVAFANVALPSEFETIGKQIAEKCHGLPLTIAVLAGLLKSKRAIEDWENVAKDVKSFVTKDPDERCSRVLRLSYNHLTSDLKTCLLHFGIFLEDSEIPVKR
ncbi:putative polygalacturonase QRT2-like [Capsicum annuum]|nr:putative polygalacturonase QRT2-like [Capsicum annuum]